ncbi:MAG: DUF4469 domain-containing protein [Treponematales bacterium]
MATNDLLDEFTAVMHRIRVKLFPNYLPSVPGAYIARTENERILSIRDVLAALRDRGGYTGDIDQLYEGIKRYYGEMVYQLCDGYAVSTGLYRVHVNVGGTFQSATDPYDPERHPLTFRIFPLALLRGQAKNIEVDVEGVAEAEAWLDEIIDVASEARNESLTVGKNFQLKGSRIKVDGEPGTEFGVYFLPTDGGAAVPVTDRLVDNQANYVAGIVPALDPAKTWRVEVRTYFSGSGHLLKNQRVIRLDKDLSVAP